MVAFGKQKTWAWNLSVIGIGIDGEVRKILSTYSRPMPEGSHEWEVLYNKTREEVFKKRFRL